MKLEAGAQVTPNVRLLRPLGEGGMGAVWIAEHRALGTEVAVKFLAGELLENEVMRARFSREAAAASQVKSAHVVKIYDHGITDTQVPFIVMELLEGEDLASRIRRDGVLEPALVGTVVTQLCKALQAAHDKSVIHRDIKPENVFLANEAGEIFVKLLDFGVAKNDALTEKTLKRSTMAGEALGTPYYMSPEQYRSSKGIDFRTDLWSVGVVVYEALTGRVPFDAENLTSLAIVVNEGKAAPPCEIVASLPKSLDAWFAKACAREPAERFQSARELAEQLRVALSLEPSVRLTFADQSGPQRVVVASGESEKDLSLQKTAFASTGASLPKRSRWPAIGAIGAVVAIGAAVVLVATGRSHGTSQQATSPTPASASVAPDKSTTPVVVVTTGAPAPSASSISVESLPNATAQPTPTPKIEAKKPQVINPKATASSKHDQIW